MQKIRITQIIYRKQFVNVIKYSDLNLPFSVYCNANDKNILKQKILQQKQN